MSLTEDKIYRHVKQFGVLLEKQLLEMMTPMTEEKLSRTLNKMWKRNMIKWGGPDNAYVMPMGGSDKVDMLYADCIWVMLAQTSKEEDWSTSYKGKEMIKLSYFSNEKQNSYNIIYITGESDYPKVSFINSKFASMVDEDMLDSTRFIFVSDNEDVLAQLPLSKFVFPYMSVKLDFNKNGRYDNPQITIVE